MTPRHLNSWHPLLLPLLVVFDLHLNHSAKIHQIWIHQRMRRRLKCFSQSLWAAIIERSLPDKALSDCVGRHRRLLLAYPVHLSACIVLSSAFCCYRVKMLSNNIQKPYLKQWMFVWNPDPKRNKTDWVGGVRRAREDVRRVRDVDEKGLGGSIEYNKCLSLERFI